MSEQFPSQSQTIHEIEPIELAQGQVVTERAQLEQIVESPALPACQLLYDRNIKTVSASANRKDGERAYIDVDFATLSAENQAIAGQIGEAAWYNRSKPPEDPNTPPDVIKVSVPLLEGDDETIVSDRLLAAVDVLQPQALRWAPVYKLDDLKAIYGYDPADLAEPEDFMGEGFYYDQTTGNFHLSQELYEKSQAMPGSESPQ